MTPANSTQNVDAGGSQVEGQPGLQNHAFEINCGEKREQDSFVSGGWSLDSSSTGHGNS